jgi:SAM-dependent methyltransferase
MTINHNHEFLLDYALSHFQHGRILDYGCGGGAIVSAGLKRGLDILGCDIFYEGGIGTEEIGDKSLLNSHILPFTENGPLPFPDAHFDLIVCNMVFEHVRDLDGTLKEIARVLKPGGTMVSLFPTIDVIREGHCGVPLAHRFAPDSKVGYIYMRTLRALGMGYHTEKKDASQWTRDFIKWLDTYCFYRTVKEASRTFSQAGFTWSHAEESYIRFRLNRSGLRHLLPLVSLSPSSAIWLFRKLGCCVITSVRA